MKISKSLKSLVKKKYSGIAIQQNLLSCCSESNCCSKPGTDSSSMYDSYDGIVGYEPEADLQLGCGIPTKYAVIKSGDTIVDLGSGAGNDVFVVRSIVGDNGYVIGIDMTEEMISRANLNKSKLGFTNIELKLGEIENIRLSKHLQCLIVTNLLY